MSFGALTDHFGLATAGLVLVDSSESIIELSRADALNEDGDIQASTYFGNTTQDMREISSTYALVSGTLDINTILLGEFVGATNIIRESVEVATSNSEWPQLTVTGRKNAIAVVAPAGLTNTYSLPSIVFTGIKQAQPINFTTGVGCRLTGSSLSGNIEVAQQDNGVGEPIAHGVSGGTGTVSAEFVRITDQASWTPGVAGTYGITETAPPGAAEGQASYHTATGTLAFTVLREATP